MLGGPKGEKATPRGSPAAPEAGVKATAPKSDPKLRPARIATAGVLFAVAGTEFASVVLARDLVIASLWVLFGFVALATGVYLYRGRFSAWGTAVIMNVFALLVAVVTLDLYVVAALIASFVVLYVFRLPFGVGAWRIEAQKEDVRSRGLIEQRLRPAAGVFCPKCGAATLWLAEDGSAFCLTCRAGSIELRPRGAA